MKSFRGRIAVITGGGTGMGRALAEQLAAEGCHVAICDVSAENMAETKALCEAQRSGALVTTHLCDVSDERQVIAFRDAVTAQHGTRHINVLFNNAGIGGGGSFLKDSRAEWEKTFGVCWFGVYYCARAFLPLLVASDEGYIVNTSSVNGFWACLGRGTAHTAYSSAKFAVKGFSEALLVDLRLHAPHVKVAVVMPGHIGTSIVINTNKVLGKPERWRCRRRTCVAVRDRLLQRGIPTGDHDRRRDPGRARRAHAALPRRRPGERGTSGDHHPRRRASRCLAHPRRRRRARPRCNGARIAGDGIRAVVHGSLARARAHAVDRLTATDEGSPGA